MCLLLRGKHSQPRWCGIGLAGATTTKNKREKNKSPKRKTGTTSYITCQGKINEPTSSDQLGVTLWVVPSNCVSRRGFRLARCPSSHSILETMGRFPFPSTHEIELVVLNEGRAHVQTPRFEEGEDHPSSDHQPVDLVAGYSSMPHRQQLDK